MYRMLQDLYLYIANNLFSKPFERYASRYVGSRLAEPQLLLADPDAAFSKVLTLIKISRVKLSHSEKNV
jgi:hypothetical protein